MCFQGCMMSNMLYTGFDKILGSRVCIKMMGLGMRLNRREWLGLTGPPPDLTYEICSGNINLWRENEEKETL